MTDYYVTVCLSCRCASCWHGIFLCPASRTAGTIDVLASVLQTRELLLLLGEGST